MVSSSYVDSYHGYTALIPPECLIVKHGFQYLCVTLVIICVHDPPASRDDVGDDGCSKTHNMDTGDEFFHPGSLVRARHHADQPGAESPPPSLQEEAGGVDCASAFRRRHNDSSLLVTASAAAAAAD